ncbi:hypothetical protein C0J52_07915 [Blattella germanica]|nr:hypothetical protein C0J52_07915 [Blattella germanica]
MKFHLLLNKEELEWLLKLWTNDRNVLEQSDRLVDKHLIESDNHKHLLDQHLYHSFAYECCTKKCPKWDEEMSTGDPCQSDNEGANCLSTPSSSSRVGSTHISSSESDSDNEICDEATNRGRHKKDFKPKQEQHLGHSGLNNNFKFIPGNIHLMTMKKG